MPFYRTGVLQDAWIKHSAVVEADNQQDAVDAAYDAWKGRRKDVVLVRDHVMDDFDHVDPIDAEDVEEITREEYEQELAENTASAHPARPALDVIRSFAVSAGWSDHAALVVLSQFIDEQGDSKALIEFFASKISSTEEE